MKAVDRRRRDRVHLTTAKRKHVRNFLLKLNGNRCCWCDESMTIPEPGTAVSDYSDMATIEHYFAKLEDEPDNINLYKLSHNRCNK